MAAGIKQQVVAVSSIQLSSHLPRPSPLTCIEALSPGQSKEQPSDHSFHVSRLTKGGQLGAIVMEVGGEVSSIALTLGVTRSVLEAIEVEGWGASLHLICPQAALCAVIGSVP